MGTAQQYGFEAGKLADLIGLLDSPVDAEAAGALHRLRVVKKKHGDAPFYALLEAEDYKPAVWQKYGGCAAPCDAGGKCHHGPEALRGWFENKQGGGNGAELSEARALVERLRQDNAQLERDGAALALAVKRQEQIIGELRQQTAAQPVAQASATAPAREYLGGLFAFSSVMGGAALLFIAARHVMAWLFGG
jgi:hypothetical protein